MAFLLIAGPLLFRVVGFLLESRLPELTPRGSTANLVLHTEPVELREFILQSYGESGAQSSPRVHLVLPEAAQWVASR